MCVAKITKSKTTKYIHFTEFQIFSTEIVKTHRGTSYLGTPLFIYHLYFTIVEAVQSAWTGIDLYLVLSGSTSDCAT